jgi:hypothetical protein
MLVCLSEQMLVEGILIISISTDHFYNFPHHLRTYPHIEGMAVLKKLPLVPKSPNGRRIAENLYEHRVSTVLSPDYKDRLFVRREGGNGRHGIANLE